MELVEPRTSVYLGDNGEFETTDELGGPKLRFGSCTFVFPNLRPYLGKIVLNDPERDLIGSNKWIPVRLREGAAVPLFLKYLLLTKPFLETYGYLCWGKSMPQLLERDLLSIRLFLPSIERQKEAAERILELERQLIQKHRTLTTRAKVIDAIFAEEFGYEDDRKWKSIDRPIFSHEFSDLGESFDLRSGVRFLDPKFDKLDELFKNTERLHFRDVVLKPFLRLGAGVDPDRDYDDNAGAFYVSPDVIKDYKIDFAVARTISDDHFRKNAALNSLAPEDVVISRSGVGIGKVALLEEDRDCIFSDFTMRIRFNRRKIDPFFGYCFCCSSMFQMQLEKNKRGASVVNFFPVQLKNFWIAHPPLERQQTIAERARQALATLDAQVEDVSRIRNEIDEIVLEAIRAARGTTGSV